MRWKVRDWQCRAREARNVNERSKILIDTRGFRQEASRAKSGEQAKRAGRPEFRIGRNAADHANHLANYLGVHRLRRRNGFATPSENA
jgi:hypothetical protein